MGDVDSYKLERLGFPVIPEGYQMLVDMDGLALVKEAGSAWPVNVFIPRNRREGIKEGVVRLRMDHEGVLLIGPSSDLFANLPMIRVRIRHEKVNSSG